MTFSSIVGCVLAAGLFGLGVAILLAVFAIWVAPGLFQWISDVFEE